MENAQATFTPAKSETSNNPIGLQVENLSDATDEIDHGVAVSTVDSDSASSGKIFEGDIITDIQAGFQRFKVEDAKDFNEIIKKFETGDKIAIFGYRDNSRFIVPITVK